MISTFRTARKFHSFVQNCSPPVGILGLPFGKGQAKPGVEKAPDVFRKIGLITELKKLGVNVKDYGNVQFNEVSDPSSVTKFPFGDLRFPEAVGSACQKTSEAVKSVLEDKRLCVAIGGDHSLGLGTVHGHSEVHDVCVLWVDAHVDINTPTTSYSGYMHGMSCSFFVTELQKYQAQVPSFQWVKPRVKKKNIAYIGLRAIDPFEKLILTKEEITHFTMADIDKLGIQEVTHRALDAINPGGKLSLHVSFDIDSICKIAAPSTGTPVLGGLTVREALYIAEEISKLDYFRALDLVEVNPEIGSKEDVKNTLEAGMLVIKTFLGHSREGSLPFGIDKIPIPQ